MDDGPEWPTSYALPVDLVMQSNPFVAGSHYSLWVHHGSDVSLETFIDLLLDTVFIVDREGTILFVSAASQSVFGYTQDEMIGRDVIDFVHPEDRPITMQTIGEILGGQLKPVFENRYLHKDGSTVHIMWSARWSDENQVRVAVARDVTEKKRAESMQQAVYAVAQATHAPGDLSVMLRHIHTVIGGLLPATNMCVVLAEPNGEHRTAYLADESGRSRSLHVPQPHDLIARVIRGGDSLRVTPDGADTHSSGSGMAEASDIPNWLGVPLRNAGGTIGALAVYSYSRDERYSEEDRELLQFVAVEVAAAIDRKTMRSELEHMARHDPLTDLPNRTLFLDRLASALSRAEREDTRLAILYMDLDDFKQVNDRYGHNVGDLLLRDVAARLSRSVRASDTVGRLGGDEFVVLLEKFAEPENAVTVAEKIRKALTASYELDGHKLMVLPSIGVAVYPENGTDEDALIGYADAAMYRSKPGRPRGSAP